MEYEDALAEISQEFDTQTLQLAKLASSAC
jgi:hypothetical protein